MAFWNRIFGSGATDAGDLAAEFARVCPPPQEVGGGIPEKRVESALRALYEQAGKIVRERKLGVIGRARLAKAFQQEMFRLGYPADLVSRVTSALTINALVKR